MMSTTDGAWNGLQFCNVCLSNTDPDYLAYNIVVSGVILAAVGAVGLVGNVLVVIVYTSAEHRTQSTSIYLAALAVSDFLLIFTAMFLFVLEAWRHHGPLSLARTYAGGATLVFPLGAIFQTTSVYFCMAVAVDCFISVVLPRACRKICCTAKNAKAVVLVLTVLSFLYNIPHFFELRSIECLQSMPYGSPLLVAEEILRLGDELFVKSLQICPTEIRNDAVYYTVYYTYMYTTFMAVGPLVLLIVLNIFVVASVMRNGATEDSDTISLILVVFLFIFCNLTALVVNFLELALYDTSVRANFSVLKLKYVIVYLVDLSNLLVIINATANFFVYLIFGKSFRCSLNAICCRRLERKFKNAPNSLLWRENETRFMALSSPSSPHTIASFSQKVAHQFPATVSSAGVKHDDEPVNPPYSILKTANRSVTIENLGDTVTAPLVSPDTVSEENNAAVDYTVTPLFTITDATVHEFRPLQSNGHLGKSNLKIFSSDV